MAHPSAFVPRVPNSSEIKQLKEFLLDEFGLGILGEDDPEKQTQDYIARSVIAVFDKGELWQVGYGTKVMSVIYPDTMGLYEVFTWDDENNICPM